MRVVKYKDLNQKSIREEIKNLLDNHKIIVYPTDTLYGIGCSFYSLEGINKINKIKQRTNKPYSIAVSNFKMLEKFVREIPDIFYKINKKYFPGKLTLIFYAADTINKELLFNSSKIGIRIPNRSKLLELIDFLNTPLITTSLNVSGNIPVQSARDIMSNFPMIDLLIDDEILPSSKGSTVIDISDNSKEVIRIGDIHPNLILN